MAGADLDEDGRQQGIAPSRAYGRRAGKRVREMIEELRARAQWIERNVLPYEIDIRTWLRCKRVRESEIDDIIQEMYAKISSLGSFEHIRDPHRYALTVAQSIFLDGIRRNRNSSELAIDNIEALERPSEDPSPEDLTALHDELRRIEQSLAKLPARTREVFMLRRIKGVSQKETAKQLSIAEKTVEKHLARAVVMLVRQYGRGGKPTSRSPTAKAGHCREEEEDQP